MRLEVSDIETVEKEKLKETKQRKEEIKREEGWDLQKKQPIELVSTCNLMARGRKIIYLAMKEWQHCWSNGARGKLDAVYRVRWSFKWGTETQSCENVSKHRGVVNI